MRKAHLLFTFFLYCLSFTVFAGVRGTCTTGNEFCAYFAPNDMPVIAIGNYLRSARQSIKISIYNASIQEYLPLLKQKLDEGVRVEFVADYKNSFSSHYIWNHLPPHPNLYKFRVPVLRGGTPQMHNKLFIIDDRVALLGSANATPFGLVANYENVIAIQNRHMVQISIDEFNEQKRLAAKACSLFSKKNCRNGGYPYDQLFHHVATTGKFPPQAIDANYDWKCQHLTKWQGLLDAGNQPLFKGVENCIKGSIKSKFKQYIDYASKHERYWDESPVSDEPPRYNRSTKKMDFPQRVIRTGAQLYYGPEDNLEGHILRELGSTLESPHESFAYVSVNFVNNQRIAHMLRQMKIAGVRIRLFFDRGRYQDPIFQQALEILAPLGFTDGGSDDHVAGKDITIFNNSLTGDYGCNHNKFAVIGSPNGGVRLLNGSANWSNSAMSKNDENVMVIHNQELVATYLREVVSQLFVYRYAQNIKSPAFWDEINYLSQYVPCLKAAIGLERSCRGPRSNWEPKSTAAIALSIEGVPVNPAYETVWVWARNKRTQRQSVMQLYHHRYFAGRWMATVSDFAGSDMEFKFFKAPIGYNAYQNGPYQNGWEYDGTENRTVKLPSIAVQKIEKIYRWGQR